ncbi:MAG: acyl carrier protein [Candidatus Rokuibacteriota bacterium]
MEPDTTKIWTRPEVRVSVGKLIVESLGVDEANVTADAELISDLGAESIDFLDLSFKCQQTFGVDLPMRLIQDPRIEWRDLTALARVLEARYGVTVAAEELRMVSPATVGAVLEHLAAKHGIPRASGDEQEVVDVLVVRMLADLALTPLDLSGLSVDQLGGYLMKNLHSPEAVQVVMSRLTVHAVADYIAAQLAAAGRLAPGA